MLSTFASSHSVCLKQKNRGFNVSMSNFSPFLGTFDVLSYFVVKENRALLTVIRTYPYKPYSYSVILNLACITAFRFASRMKTTRCQF
jgi:hypothetical protein